jgi:hypothetical protein
MPATVLAAITALEQVFFGKHEVTFFGVIIIVGFQFVGRHTQM